MVLDSLGAKIIELSGVLSRNNIPFIGISQTEITYPDNATAEQISAGEAIFSSFDWQAPPVPQVVSPLQARRALRQFGLLETVNTGLSQMSEEDQEAWEYATEVRRNDPVLTQVSQGLNLTETQLDDFFKLAASL